MHNQNALGIKNGHRSMMYARNEVGRKRNHDRVIKWRVSGDVNTCVYFLFLLLDLAGFPERKLIKEVSLPFLSDFLPSFGGLASTTFTP